MKHLVVGTAGHIDHGKSTLIKGLTAIDPDRLEEEKKRGITIVLGYAHYQKGENTISFVDVPGHEKFVKTMLAGATGIDLVMLVIAADEGIMPQTIEHFTIIKHLGISEGLIVLTKTDKVSEDDIATRKDEIKAFFKGSFLEEAPVYQTRVDDVKGYQEVKADLESRLRSSTKELETLSSRMYIDRVFTLKGKGTVITGTLVEGVIEKGDTLWLYPGQNETRVKQIQVHGQNVDRVTYGNRVALNITSDYSDIQKGMLITSVKDRPWSMILDVILEANGPMRHWERVRFFHGTSEVMGRLVLPNQEKLVEGQVISCQIRLEEAVFINVGDRFVLRRFSPVETIGGGRIANTQGQKRHFTNEGHLEEDISILNVTQKFGLPFDLSDQAFKQLSISQDHLASRIEALVTGGHILKLSDRLYMHKEAYEEKKGLLYDFLERFHEKSPYKLGIKKAEVKSKVFKDLKKQYFDILIEAFILDNTIKMMYQWICQFDFEVIKDQGFYNIFDTFIDLFTKGESPLVSMSNLEKVSEKSQNHSDLLTYLNYHEFIVKISEDHYVLGDFLNQMKSQLLDYFKDHTEISVATFRDLTKSSRKVSVSMLEYFDAIGLTKRLDNIRIFNK